MINNKKITRHLKLQEQFILMMQSTFILKLQKKNLIGEIFNLGSGKKYTIKKIYNYLKELTGYKKTNSWNSMKNRYWDQLIWYSDMSYVRKKIKWKPKIDLKYGLEKTVRWYRKFYDEK